MRPVVAIVAYGLGRGRVDRWSNGAFAVPDHYVAALTRAGASSVILPPAGPPADERILELFDGLMLIGGGDIDPRRYGADPHPEVYGVDADRDELELALARAARSIGVPTFGICRGAQVLNVAFGGTLIQHLVEDDDPIPGGTGVAQPTLHGNPTGEPVLHDVKVSEGSRLAEACERLFLTCSSHHHQAIDAVGEGLNAVAWSDDGLPEAVEAEVGWAVGVQWHPEDTASGDPAQQSLFDAFAERAAVRARRR